MYARYAEVVLRALARRRTLGQVAIVLLPLALIFASACGSSTESPGTASVSATNLATRDATATTSPSDVDAVNRKLVANNQPTVDAAEYATYLAVSLTPLPTTTIDSNYTPVPADCGPRAARAEIPARFGQIRAYCHLYGTQWIVTTLGSARDRKPGVVAVYECAPNDSACLAGQEPSTPGAWQYFPTPGGRAATVLSFKAPDKLILNGEICFNVTTHQYDLNHACAD